MPRIFPPRRVETPEGYWRNGLGNTSIRTAWGDVQVSTQRLKNRAGKQAQVPLDAALDASGWSPGALTALLDLCARLPFEEASVVAHNFGLKVSDSELERLTRPMGAATQTAVREQLTTNAQAPCKPGQPGRVMVLQADGVYVLARPEDGACPGVEVKTAVLYPQAAPNERWLIADVTPAGDFIQLLEGLIHHAGVTPQDELIGLSDGAAWIEAGFDMLGIKRITDVYHATNYLEEVMLALGWEATQRAAHRRSWCRGEINARDWLKAHQPPPETTDTWSQTARNSLNYLTQRVNSMDYAQYTQRGYPIGSGQIEGANKNVIGTRLKRSGMHWSRPGAGRMAAIRAQLLAKHPLTTFNQLRHHAYQPSP